MISREDYKDVKRELGGKMAKKVSHVTKDGFDPKKRWGNSAIKGHGVNSPAMMSARNKAIHAKKGKTHVTGSSHKEKVDARFEMGKLGLGY